MSSRNRPTWTPRLRSVSSRPPGKFLNPGGVPRSDAPAMDGVSSSLMGGARRQRLRAPELLRGRGLSDLGWCRDDAELLHQAQHVHLNPVFHPLAVRDAPDVK